MKALFITIILAVLAVFYFAVADEAFRFHGADLFLWGGAEQSFLYLTGALIILATLLVAGDSIIKKRRVRQAMGVMLVLFLLFSLYQYIRAVKILSLAPELIAVEHPDIYDKQFPPVLYQMASWGISLALLIYFLVKTAGRK
ncbi:hypothetical protein [Niabella beijingensis]|uniref:hypothetical protein n=1 Tax=Niabella beijingensis TaxID=2872700 RepID=UPI001CC12BD2|nr:hypothetical protein [Niabella beijingensis]MBZ4190998.1 hypothetical protein [Niabella beijingensis]